MSSGYCVNSHQLVDIIKKELLRAGWSIRSELNSRDYVFYSQGSDGNQDIYIRVAAGLYDYRTDGAVQKFNIDGYNGYVNFLAYQYFPENGVHGNLGSNEIGRSGPSILMVQGENTPVRLEEYDMIGSHYDATRRYVRWQTTNSSDGNYSTYTPVGSDGHTKFYFDNAGSTRYVLNLDRDDNDFAGRTSLSSFPLTVGQGMGVYHVDGYAGDHYIYAMSLSSPGKLMAHNLTQNSINILGTAPWLSTTGNGFVVHGMARNGINRLYISRGSTHNDWAYYEIETNTWTTASPLLPTTGGVWMTGVFVPREVSGFPMDRLYVTCGTSAVYSISIDDEGNAYGNWLGHASIGFISVDYGAKLFLLGTKIIYVPASSSDMIYEYHFPSSYSFAGSWEAIVAVTPASAGGGLIGRFTCSSAQHHLISRVRADDNGINSYWAIADEDRVIVVTKDSSSRFWYSYAGLFNTYSSKDIGILTDDANSGDSIIYLNDAGTFRPGEKYTVIDITGDSSTHLPISSFYASDHMLHNLFDGYYSNVGSSEVVTVTNVDIDNNYIEIESPLTRSYKTGSKIGADPQPVMVRASGFDEAYTLNSSILSDNHSSKDPPYQRYKLRKLYDITNVTDSLPRNLSGSVFPISLYSNGPNNIGESEVRGDLIGVYWVGDDFIGGNVYEINGERYLAFKPYDNSVSSSQWSSTGKILVGPLE